MKSCAYCGQPEELFIHPLVVSPKPPHLAYHKDCREKAFKDIEKKPLTDSQIWATGDK